MKWTILLVVGIAILFVGILGLPGTHSTHVTETLLGTGGGEPSVASGQGILVYTANGPDSYGYRSLDHGTTWQSGTENLHLGDNGVSIGNRVVITKIWDANRTGITRSTDGQTWDTFTEVQNRSTAFLFPDGKSRVPCTSNEVPFVYDFPKVSAQRDSIYVVAQSLFDANDNGTCPISNNSETVIHSTDGGVTWHDALIVPKSTQRFFNVVQNNGTAVLAGMTAGCRGITVWWITNETSQSECTFALTPTVTSVAVDGNGNVWVAFEYTIASQHHIGIVEVGATNLPIQIDDISLPTDVTDRILPSLSISDTGRFDLAWIDFRNSADHKNADVYYSSSTDGTVWSSNVKVSTHTAPTDVLGNDYITTASDGQFAFVAYAQKPTGSTEFNQYVAKITP